MRESSDTTGTINANRQIIWTRSYQTMRRLMCVIILFDEGLDTSKKDWVQTATKNSAFNFLDDEVKDIYTLADGKSF